MPVLTTIPDLAKEFAYSLAYDPLTTPDDEDMTTLLIAPYQLFDWFPYGKMHRGSDGQPLFSGKPEFKFMVNLPQSTRTDGNVTIPTGRVTFNMLMADWRLSQRKTNQLVWIRFPDFRLQADVKALATWQRPDPSGKPKGTAVEGLVLHFCGIGADTTVEGWKPGEQNPPTSTDGETLGDGTLYGFGFGAFGHGPFGVGGM